MNTIFQHITQTLPEFAICQRVIDRGECLFQTEEKSNAIYFLHKGHIALQRVLITGDIVSIHTARSGEFFAEAALFSERYHCDARAIEASTISQIASAPLRQALEDHPELALSFASHLAKTLRDTRLYLEIRSLKSARQRVLTAMQLNLYREPITNFAQALGMTHEACYRTLRALVKDGQITQTARGRYALSKPKTSLQERDAGRCPCGQGGI